jgi:hypothetical protein
MAGDLIQKILRVRAGLKRVFWRLYGNEEIIDKLAKEWLGKKGVVGIGLKEVNGEECVIFYVLYPFRREEYPDEVYGYKVEVVRSGPIVAL